jgi:transcription elongation factor GreB
MAASRYITPQGFHRLAVEHQDIWTVQRPRIVAEVEAAAALGDRSENAEYIYGKRKLRELDRRLRYLSELMDSLTVMEPAPHPSGRAYFGAWVTIEAEDGEPQTWRLVGPDEFDVAGGLLSVDSPLGRALLGKAAGAVVTVQRPAGTAEVTVLEVSWRSAAAGDRPARPAAKLPPASPRRPARPARPRRPR